MSTVFLALDPCVGAVAAVLTVVSPDEGVVTFGTDVDSGEGNHDEKHCDNQIISAWRPAFGEYQKTISVGQKTIARQVWWLELAVVLLMAPVGELAGKILIAT